MKISHCVLPTGHFVTIETGMSVRTYRTENGTAYELTKLAQEMEDKAEMLRMKANTLRAAATLVNEGKTSEAP